MITKDLAMTDYNITVGKELLPELLTNQNGLAKLIESVLNQILEAQVEESLGADKYERTDERVGYRNGYRPRQLYTRVGPITLQVPQTRDGAFSTEIFKRYQRSEQAFVLALMEMVVHGVSTRKATHITEELCGSSFSKSTVSQLCVGLDARIKSFNERRLEEHHYPFIMVDAMFFKSRDNDRVVSRAALSISGIRADGYREVLGVKIGETESYATWEETFKWLKSRGLKGVVYIISDQHSGLVDAARRCFQGVSWQRCQVHLMRNILGSCSLKYRKEVAEQVKLIFQSADMHEARRRLNDFIDEFEKKTPKAVKCLEDGFEDAMAVMSLPTKYRKRFRTTNMQERLNQELRGRERVIRIFPNDDSALRLIGALLAEMNEQWQTKRYLDMDEFNEWWEGQKKETSNILELNSVI
jgi:putative transposase